MFVDADVLVAPDTLCRATRFLRENPDVAAVFGGYDDRPEAQNLVSQYKNLLHHFVHQHSRSQAMTFWAGCGAIRAAAFRQVGGFDEDRYPKPSIEDIDLGYRLREAGNQIWLDKQMQVTHLKRWSLGSLLRSDIFDRAIPWSRLVLEKGRLIDDLNLKVEQRVSAALVAASAGLLLLAPWSRLAIIGAVASAAAVLVINRRLIALFHRCRNAAFAASAGFMHLLYLGYSGAAFVACWGLHVTGLGRVALRWR